jgi:hypothetical protein
MRSLLLLLVLGGCATALPHRAADPSLAGTPPAEAASLDWRQPSDAMIDPGGALGHTGYKR